MKKMVYLFPDTNVLVQCLALDQLDWSAWREFDEVHLIVTRPVQAEIDNQKNKGGDRLARRARKASALLRDVILSGQGHSIVRPSDPCVKLFIRNAIRPSPELAEVLDYSRPDDQLVGTAYAFAQQDKGADARVLTHDTGPMASAQMIGLGIAAVPDDWLLPPEPSEVDKTIHALRAEVARLKETEPRFLITCIDAGDRNLDRLDLEVTHYQPLSEARISKLLARIKAGIPMSEEFGGRERTEKEAHGPLGAMGMNMEVFTPATDGEIQEYRDQYKAWLNQCESRLRSLHDELQEEEGTPIFAFAVSNEGSRPAIDALITFKAMGRFQIMPPPYRHSDDDEDESDGDEERGVESREIRELPPPPTPPQGHWDAAMQVGALQVLRQFQRDYELPILPRLDDSVMRRLDPPRPRDPNEFYYKPERVTSPTSEFSLECDQWRHGVRTELFSGQIHVDEDAKEVSGALECRIHAQNLSKSATKLIPVRIRVKHSKVLEFAEGLVSSLCYR